MPATFETLMRIDAQLAAAGQHSLTPHWKREARRYYEHPTADVYIGECGRGSAKSYFGSRIGFNETLCGDFVVPGGECHFWIDVSENKAEASQRLGQYEEWLKAFGVNHERRGDEIILPDLRRGFLVRAAQVGRLSGFRGYGLRVDEAAKLTSADNAANPLPELWASGTAMLVTHLRHRPKRLMLSSPVGLVGYFNDRARAGDTSDQVVAQNVPTWVANPSVTEEQTRRLEPDERVWRREYLAIPQEARLAAFPAELVEQAFRSPPRFRPTGQRVLAVDPSSGRKDTWSWAVVAWGTEIVEPPPHAIRERVLEEYDAPTPYGVPFRGYRYVLGPPKVQNADGSWTEVDISNPRSFLIVDQIDGFEGRFYQQISAGQVVARVASVARAYGITTVHSDQREDFSLRQLFSNEGLHLEAHDWTGGDTGLKVRMVSALRRRLAERTIFFPAHEKLKRELLSFEEQFTPSGALTFGARGSGHDDYIAAILTALSVEISGRTTPNFRHISDSR